MLNFKRVNRSESTQSLTKTVLERRLPKQHYQYYFRIDYKIAGGACQSIYIFNASSSIAKIQHLVRRNCLILTINTSYRFLLLIIFLDKFKI